MICSVFFDNFVQKNLGAKVNSRVFGNLTRAGGTGGQGGQLSPKILTELAMIPVPSNMLVLLRAPSKGIIEIFCRGLFAVVSV